MSVINHADANPQPPAWPHDNLSPGRAPTLLLQAGGGNWDLGRWDHAGQCWDGGRSMWGMPLRAPPPRYGVSPWRSQPRGAARGLLAAWRHLHISHQFPCGIFPQPRKGTGGSAPAWDAPVVLGGGRAVSRWVLRGPKPSLLPQPQECRLWIHHRAGCTQQACSSLTQRSWCWLQGRPFFFFK